MKFNGLGNTGVFVSELCLGTMTFGSQWEFIGALQQKDADALVNRSIDAGVNFFDTADVYSSGESEEILGRALAPKRQDVVIATKVRGRMGPGANDVGLSRLHIIGSSHKCMHDLARSRSSTPGEEAADVLVAGIQRGSRLSLSRRPPARPRSWWGACSAAVSSTARC